MKELTLVLRRSMLHFWRSHEYPWLQAAVHTHTALLNIRMLPAAVVPLQVLQLIGCSSRWLAALCPTLRVHLSS